VYIKSLAPARTRSLENSSHGIRPIVFLESLKSLAFAEQRMSGGGGGGPFTFYCGRNNARGARGRVQRKAQRNYNHAQQGKRGMPPRRLQLKSFLLKFQQPCIYFFRLARRASEREERGWNLPLYADAPLCVPLFTIERILLGVRQRAGINSASIEWNINTPINRKRIELAASAPMH
jgi:hypothetical protein